VQLGVEDREPQPVVGEAVLWRAVPAQGVGAAWPACRCTCSYLLCSDWRSQAIVPLNSDSRVERTGDGAPAVQEALHKARDKCRGLVRQPWNVFVMRIPVAAFAA
jgi:hypothetical protein